ncbi:major facilitator superfamily domain-containing protein [Phyllosticta citribraziliensis]|uniref:Major facilitator superfamily domain-containing protein n=1 Tax=Phyllosticta citribraziliensis TaxID=989973 RepID=A0ABR1LXS8_9PEZI
MITDSLDERDHRKLRILSVVAATSVALACGTNYAYSAWAPQFADRLQLSATQSNLIGVAGNIGMYASGIPTGMLVDSKGPRPAGFLGSLLIFAGYFPLKKAYDNGPGSMSMVLLSFLSFLTGLGSSGAFSAALKTAATNWPNHRGTATAFPLAAFGLSAFFFTTISRVVFPGNTSGLLMLLACLTLGMAFVGTFFLQLVSPENASYSAVPTGENAGHRPRKSRESDFFGGLPEEDRTDQEASIGPSSRVQSETTSLLSELTASEESKSISQVTVSESQDESSHRTGISGVRLLRTLTCWQLFSVLGLLTGIGLMTINNIGHDTTALWSHYDDSASKEFISHAQLTQVSIISVGSFLGRLTSGIGSDFIVKQLGLSRFWCLILSALIFTTGQFVAMNIEDPNHLWMLSGLTGLAYGALFGVFPSIVADAFGVQVMTQNWGFMTLSPVVSGNIFNLCYGSIYDHQSVELEGGERECTKGLSCYRAAYGFTFAGSLIGLLLIFWTIRHEHNVRRRREQANRFEHAA